MRLSRKLVPSLALAAFVLSAQAPNAAPEGPVRLSVAAIDASGEPVSDLKIEDFQLSDQGKPQRIVFFRPASASALDASPLTPHESSNRTGGNHPHSAVILFDLLNENQMDRLDVWHKLGRSLAQLESGDSIYFYLLTLEGTLNPIHAIGDKANAKTWPQQVEKTLDRAMKAASHARPAEMGDPEMVVKKTYVAFETLATQLAMIPGRRDIIWITNGMPNVWNPKTPCNGDWVDCALYVPHMAVTLGLTSVAVNPLSYTSSPGPDMTRDLEQFAGLTGGWTYMAEDIRSVLKQVGRDATSSYSVAYDPGTDNWDSKFHKVRLTTERKGVKLHVKNRYYAFPDKKPEATQQAALAAAYQSAADDPSIGLRAVAAPGAGGKSVNVQFRIDPADLLLRDQGGASSGAIIYLIADIGVSGPVGNPAMSRFEVHLTAEQRAQALKAGVPIMQDHAINESIQKIRVIVLDQGSNRTGSLTIPVHPGS